MSQKVREKTIKYACDYKISIGTIDVHSICKGIASIAEEQIQYIAHDSTKPTLNCMDDFQSKYAEHRPSKASLQHVLWPMPALRTHILLKYHVIGSLGLMAL